MQRIIRSNAVKTSNQTGNGGINPSNLPSDSEFASSLANISVKNPKIYGGALAYPVGEENYAQCSAAKLTSDIVLSTASAKNSTTINSDKGSTLQTVFDRPPSAIPPIVLLSSIAFLTIVLTWIWSLRIEEVSHLRGKFVPSVDSKQLFQVTKQEVMMNADETQAQQNHSHLVETQKQQLMSIQIRLNKIKALMGENLLAQLTTNPQSVEQLGSMYAVEVSFKDLISKNTNRNRAAISTADNTIDSFKPNQNAIQTMATTELLKNLLLKSVKHQSIQIEDQQINKLAKDITLLQAKLTEAKTRINKIQLNKQQLSNSIGELIHKPQQHLARKEFSSKQAIYDIAPQTFILTPIPNQEIKFIQPGDRIQIKLDTYPQHHENIIIGKVLSIVDEPNTKILDNATRLQIVVDKDLLINQQLQSNIKVNQTATAKIIYHHRIADMFFDPINN